MRDAFLPYGRQDIDDEDIAAVVAVLRGDWLTTGPTVEAFETAFAEAVGASEAVACANGTAGLHLAALALGLGPGDQVVVPSVTFLATANAVRYVGAEVVFADVDPETGLMRAEDLVNALKGRDAASVKAVFPVHLSGHCVDLQAISDAASGLMLVEDACHALGGSYRGGSYRGGSYRTSGSRDAETAMVPVGSCPFGGVTMFSTHPVKTMTTGEGGVLTTNDADLAASLRRFRNHGMVRDPDAFLNRQMAFESGEDGAPAPWYYEMHEPGFNYRLTDIQCALGLSQLKRLGEFVETRRRLRRHYGERLSRLGPHVALQPTAPGCDPSWHLAVSLIDFAALDRTRTRVMTDLKSRGIGTQVHYVPVPRQPYYAERYGVADLPGTDAYYARCLSLPLFAAMTEDDVDRVVDTLAAVLGVQC
jgi:UDP-4-amino-4,6-dideoxy-N-acetyl-beta-L-altrosamine transaminase